MDDTEQQKGNRKVGYVLDDEAFDAIETLAKWEQRNKSIIVQRLIKEEYERQKLERAAKRQTASSG
jgi:predicted transcriptional regulator